MITFISESRQASWFFLFKGNGVASYIYFHGLMWASGVLFGAWERALTHFHIWVSSVELILAAWLHWCMCLSLICSSLQEGTTHFMTNFDSVYTCWIHFSMSVTSSSSVDGINCGAFCLIKNSFSWFLHNRIYKQVLKIFSWKLSFLWDYQQSYKNL